MHNEEKIFVIDESGLVVAIGKVNPSVKNTTVKVQKKALKKLGR